MSLPGAISLLSRQTAKLSSSAVTGVLPTSKGGTGISASNAAYPITLYVKSVTVLTAGSPADIATITIPAGITRWAIVSFADASANSFLAGGSGAYIETSSGAFASAAFIARTAAGGGGTSLGEADLDDVEGQFERWLGDTVIVSASSSIYIRQTANSANAGTVSFYITIYPLP